MKFILTATRKDNSRLHLLNRGTEYQPWVICWNYDPINNSWDWGTYCNSLKEALKVFSKKCNECDFTDVVEGYVEKNNTKKG